MRIKRYIFYFLYFVNIIIIFSFWFNQNSGVENTFIFLGRLSGLLGTYLILVQLLLIGRVKWLERYFGLDKLSRFHHYNGILGFLLIVLHGNFITIGYSQASSLSIFSQYLNFFQFWPYVTTAIIAMLLLFIVIISSILISRIKMKYEHWYYVHLLTYLAIVLAFFHQVINGSDFSNKVFLIYWYFLYIFIFGNLLLFRFLRPVFLYCKHRFYVEKVIKENEKVVSIYITGKSLNEFKVEAGQFLIFRFLSKKFFLETHPFSLSQSCGKYLRITVKNVGDFTSKIQSIKIGTGVLIDGPYGIFTKKQIRLKKVAFIAGGIGITPIRTLLENVPKKSEIILLYSNKTKKDTVFEKEIDELAKKLNFKWILILTEEPDYKGEKGRINLEKVKKFISDFKKWEYFICGPAPMMDNIIKELKENKVPNIQIHFEKFSLH